VQTKPKNDLDWVDWHLENWARFTRLKTYRHELDYVVSHFLSVAGSMDFDGMCAVADENAAKAVDAILDGFPSAQQCAVRKIHLGEAWQFPRNNMDELYDIARESLGIELHARGFV
jgi:hypothetical protein